MQVPECELLRACAFFTGKVTSMPATVELIMKNYCHGDNLECARFLVFQELGRPRVPQELFPSDVDWARRLIESR